MRRILLILTVVLLCVPAGQARESSTQSQLRHSTNVLRFFNNHSWLLAPNKKKCREVPWQKSCTIARRIYKQKQAWLNHYHYNWESWLPSNWKGVARCETHFNWEHNNSRFVSAFGISWREYNADAAHMGAPAWHIRHTPRDQYMAALGHYNRFGDGWTCPGP